MSFVGKWFGFGIDESFDDGIRAYESNHFDQALESFRSTVASAKDKATQERAKNYVAGCLGKLAQEAWDLREFGSALSLLEEAVTIRPGFADLWMKLGYTQLIIGDINSAKSSATKAQEINPKYAQAGVLLGTILFREGEHQAGIEAISSWITEGSALDTTAWKNAKSAFEEGDMDETYAQLKEIKPAPSDVNDMIAEGDLAAKEGQWIRAEVVYRQAMEMAGSFPDIRCRYGQALMEIGELNQSVEQFEIAVKLNPKYSEAYALLGVVYRRQDEEEKAMESFRKALEIDPDHPIASQEILHPR